MSDSSTSNGDWSEVPQIPTDAYTATLDLAVDNILEDITMELTRALRHSERGGHVYIQSNLLYKL